MIRKIRLIYDVTTWKQTFAMHRLSNISGSKRNQAMEFSESIEHNMQNFFLEKSYLECSGEAILKPFSKKLKLSVSLNQQSKVS